MANEEIVSPFKFIFRRTVDTSPLHLRLNHTLHTKQNKIYSSPGAASISCSTTMGPPFPRKARAALLLLLLSLAGAGAAPVVVVVVAAAAAATVGVGTRVLSGRPSRIAVCVICVVEQCQSRALDDRRHYFPKTTTVLLLTSHSCRAWVSEPVKALSISSAAAGWSSGTMWPELNTRRKVSPPCERMMPAGLYDYGIEGEKQWRAYTHPTSATTPATATTTKPQLTARPPAATPGPALRGSPPAPPTPARPSTPRCRRRCR